MTHISELALFDYVAGKADLTEKEIEHVKECDDCREETVTMRRLVEESPDIDKVRCLLAEEGELPLPVMGNSGTDADAPESQFGVRP